MPVSAPRFAPGRAPFRHQSTGYDPSSACYNNPTYSGSFYCSSLFGSVFGHRRPPVYYGGAFVPYYWGMPLDETETENQAEPQPPVPEQDNALAGQVQALTNEVELLREEQESGLQGRAYPPQPAQTKTQREAKAHKLPTTAFIYRDGRQLEAQNYAILGKTLWVFDEDLTRKIPLNDLDLDATQKRNEDRGVEFVPPNGD